MSENPFKAMMEARKQSDDLPEVEAQPEEEAALEEEPAPRSQAKPPKKENRKRGRPATGKRSDPGWIGRTYYIQESTDIDIEIELAMLRRQGVDLDKSELVDRILAAWVKWRKGENTSKLLGEISPRRKD